MLGTFWPSCLQTQGKYIICILNTIRNQSSNRCLSVWIFLSFVWNIDTVRWSGVWRNHLIYVLDSDYIFVGKVPGHVIYCILLQHAACVSLLRVSMPSLSFLTLPRDPPPHFRNTCLCCLISVIIIHFSVSQQQAAGGKSLSCDNFSTPVVSVLSSGQWSGGKKAAAEHSGSDSV